VLVLDCDGTLWDGVVGEDGPDGVKVGPARHAVRTLLADQAVQGRLLCLASNNDVRDVHEVFERRPDWPLTLEQVTASRIDWTPKSEKLRSLAAELGLGLDSFVLIDDDPVQCGEVRAACPEVLTVQLPADPDAALDLLRHCWPLDPRPCTSADEARSRYYREAGEREQHRAQLSHADFIASLDLVVSIAPVQPDERDRVRQLSERTNQFNLTGARPPGGPGPAGEIRAVQVRDRFGDYGLVGAVALRTGTNTLFVDMFLLSCRALARGVEHRIAAHVGALAVARGLSSVVLDHRDTGRNQPALAFLATLPGQVNPADPSQFVVSADALAAVRHDPGASAVDPAPVTVPPRQRADVVGSPPYSWMWVARVATDLASPAAVLAAGRAFARRDAAANPALTEVRTERPPTAMEQTVMRMWADLLGVEPRSTTDSLLDLGGNSLLLVQFMARVHADLRVELPIDILFTSAFTVAEVAAEIHNRLLADATDDELADVLQELDGLSDAEIEALLAGDGV
jgi:FkbH-like protein